MDPDTQIGGGEGRFPDTHRSVLSAAASEDGARRGVGQEALITAYWKPVYRYIRIRWRCSNEDAKDLTQGFFSAAIERNFFHAYDPGKGTFRTFLRVCLDRFLSNERKFAARLKRSAETEALDWDPPGGASPDQVFEKEWSRGVFEDAVEMLREKLTASGRALCFQVFERYDLAEDPPCYAALAREFGITEATVTNYLASARRELRRLVLEKVRSVTPGEKAFQRDARAILK
jgi:RNA polymerase sigma factor (sigma-70 family)